MTEAGQFNAKAPKASLICAGVVFIVSFILYWATLAPTVTLVDSGELILAAHVTGVPHPPGFPLYVLLAHAASLLPVGNVAQRIHFASALFAALAAAFMTLLIIEAALINTAPAKKSAKSSRKAGSAAKKTDAALADASSGPDLITILAPGVIGGLLFAFSRTLWAYATVAEVYTLNAMLIAGFLWLIISWRRQLLAAATGDGTRRDRKLYIAAFIFGLALGVHHVTVALTLPALAVLVYSAEGRAFFLSRRLLYAALISLAGLSVYIYLPLAASQSPLMNWGDPSTFERFWWHISGRQYQGYFDFSFSRITEFLYLAAREFGLWWKPFALVTAIVGSLYLTRRDIAMFWALALIIVADLLYCLSYPIAEDKDAYYLPAFMALTIAVGFGVHFLVTVTQNLTSKPIFTLGRTSAILLVIPLVAVTSNFDFANRSRYFIAHDYVDNMFSSVEPGGMLLTSDWQAYAPSLYVRDVEGQRKDIIFIDINLLRRSWYFSYLDQAYPEVTARSRGVIDIYLADLRAFEKDPRAFEKNTSLNLQINRRFEDMLLALAISQLEHAPLYLTLELVDPTRSAQDSELTKKLMEKYDFIPQGLIFRANGKNAPIDLNETELTIRGFSDGTLKFDDDDIVNKSVKPVYLDMFTNSGMVLAAKGRHDKAIVMFNQALKVDPNFEPAKKALGQSRRALQKRPG